jgi:hypothetical protein
MPAGSLFSGVTRERAIHCPATDNIQHQASAVSLLVFRLIFRFGVVGLTL